MRKILSLLLSFTLILTIVPDIDVSAATASGKVDDNITWVLDRDGTLTFSGTGQMKNYTSDDIVPWNDYKSSISKVAISNGITHIGSRAFNEFNLTSVEIPDSVTSIGYMAFAGNNFTTIDIPNSVTEIKGAVFKSCLSLASIALPDGLTKIFDSLFANCTSLETISIPASVVSISSTSFDGCDNLKTIVYSGTESEWENLTKDVTSADLQRATVTYGNTGGGTTGTTTEKYSITVSSCTNGTVETDKNSAAAGETVAVTANASNGYTLSRILVDGQELTGNTFTVSGNHTVSAEFIATGNYTVSLGYETLSVLDGETATVDIHILSDINSVYNAVDITLNYSGVELVTASLEGYTLTKSEGTVHIQGYGKDKAVGTDISLQFSNPVVSGGTVELVTAYIDKSSNAISADAPRAQLGVRAAAIILKGYAVTLDETFIGGDIAEYGADYVFTAKNLNYTYSVTATVDGAAVAVTDNGDGTFTIRNVTGPLVITATRTPKTYDVTVSGNAAGDVATTANKATYGTDYTFTVNKTEHYSYSVKVEIGGVNYSYAESDGTYTIKGADITGAIEITAEKELSELTVEFKGNAAGAATGDKIAAINENYTFTLNKTAGYTYTVTILMGDKPVTPEITDNQYTVKDVTANLVITIESILDVEVTVNQYLKLDNTAVYLVTVKGETPDGYVISYDTQPMYRSAQYNSYAYLVISEQELTKEAATARVGHINATTEEIGNTGDVNNTGKIDINDAQLIYDIYNAKYPDFSQVSMKKFLCADTNNSLSVNIDDAVRIITKLN